MSKTKTPNRIAYSDLVRLLRKCSVALTELSIAYRKIGWGLTADKLETEATEHLWSANRFEQPEDPGSVAQSEPAKPISPERMVRHPTFDANGYPTEETEIAIKAWDFRDVPGWLEYIREAWNHHYGRMWEENGMLKMATGGWSGNEAITRSMRENYILWSLLWESSNSGGLEVLRMPNVKLCDTAP